jgi:excinuclease ABC subunit C
MKESLLDDCPGVSPRRKEQLLKRFGSVQRVREATEEELAEIPGISTKSARGILEWLAQR